MKSKFLIFLSLVIVVLSLLVGCGKKEVKEPEEVKGKIIEASLNDLFDRKESLVCSFEEKDDEEEGAEVSVKGIIYIDGKNKRMRADASSYSKIDNAETEIKASSIFIGDDIYTWNDAMKNQGFKFSNKDDDNEDSDDEYIDLDKKEDLNCKPWKVDNSLFELPKDVKFTDMKDAMKEFESKMQDFQKELDKHIEYNQ